MATVGIDFLQTPVGPEISGFHANLGSTSIVPCTHILISGFRSAKQYQVKSTGSRSAIVHEICQVFHSAGKHPASQRAFSAESFSICVLCPTCRVAGAHEKLFKTKVASIRIHFDSKTECMDYLISANEDEIPITITGTLEQVRNGLQLVPSSCDTCSLRVTAPRATTVNRLVKAVLACQKFPNKLGVCFALNAVFAIKPLRDMDLLLGSLLAGSDEHAMLRSRNDARRGPPNVTLVSLHSPTSIF